ncbi:TIGR01777 family oxidoreductase [Winogradskyella sp. 3972H.M.0a.05]|uniref:TIGR01777 family oxidoreductase n=1 Tax=Winogradskyella sp. 3972H.M.0a.05 TaxID=2950277 RepID=UPI0033934D2C
MKVLITGATGLIGKAIVEHCFSKGIDVHYLTTSKAKLSNTEHYKGFLWNPSKKEIDIACFDGVDTIINLAGASISKRWTKSYKQKIIDSRLSSLALLYSSISKHNFSIKHLISASAIGIYPDSLTNYYEEDFKKTSKSFLGEVASKWEDAVDVFKDLNIETTKIRIGLVLSRNGGALPSIIRPIKIGFGSAFGTGEQWQSWIHVEDLAEMFIYCAEENLYGVYNGVAPNPVTNMDMTRVIAKKLKKPLIFPNTPKFALKIILGEMHILLLESQRVSANKIEARGFYFKFPNLQPALEDLL